MLIGYELPMTRIHQTGNDLEPRYNGVSAETWSERSLTKKLVRLKTRISCYTRLIDLYHANVYQDVRF